MENFWQQFDFFTSAEGIMGMLTLCVLEIVLGIDNLVFISILVDKAPKEKQRFIRLTGLSLALIFRVVMLFGITFLTHLETPVFTINETYFSWRDIILLSGGLFLITKSTLEIHHKIMAAGLPEDIKKQNKKSASSLASLMIAQIILIDIIFSIDSILTAVGLTNNIALMIFAVVIAIVFMMLFAKTVSDFINRNPTIVMLALSFLMMIGTLLIADAFHFHVPRGYIYFAMAFSLMVEILNLILLKRMSKKIN